VVDIATGKVRQRCRGHQGIIQETALSADSKILASRSEDDTLRIWDTSSGKEIRRLNVVKQEWGQYQPMHLALAPNGKMVAWVGTENERPIHIYDISTGEKEHRLLEHPGGERGILFSPRGDLLLASCDKGPDQLWDVHTGRLVHSLPHKPVMQPSAATFSADGSRFALVIEGIGLQLYETATGKETWHINWNWDRRSRKCLLSPRTAIPYSPNSPRDRRGCFVAMIRAPACTSPRPRRNAATATR
jgi:WD40 repeat protein